MTILAATGAALAGFAACWLWLRPRLADGGRLVAESDRRELALREEIERREVELGAARRELVEARTGAAAAAARLATLEEKLPETVRSISQEALHASR